MSKKSKILWLVVVVVVALVAIILWARSRNNNADRAGNMADGSGQLESAEDTSEGSVNKKPASSGASAPALTYTQALAKYAGRVIQFDEQCQATPSNITLKNNTDIMLDNRSLQSRVLTVGESYTVKGYGYKIVKLSSGVLPRTILVDCQGKQNVATIYLQR